MYSNYYYPVNQNYPRVASTTGYQNNNDDRLGGFVFPFLLGGVTGAAIAPAFWGGGYGYNNRPYYYSNNYYYPPYYYGPYYR